MTHNFIEDVKALVDDSIPTPARIVGEVIRTAYDADSSAADLAAVIERDPTLTAKILKIANSAYYGAATNITSLKRSVVVLGFDTIKELVTTVATVHYFFRSESASKIDLVGLWQHSVGTAKATQLLSSRLNKERPDVMYTVGLLHDIGKILLALSFPDNYMDVISMVKKKKFRLLHAEQILLNTDHSMIGKVLCDLWNLPQALSDAILFHHEPMELNNGDRMMAKLINIGDYMCRKAEIGFAGDYIIVEPSNDILEVFGSGAKKRISKQEEIFEEYLTFKDDIEGFYSGLQ